MLEHTSERSEVTETERRETMIENFASLALEGMYPTKQDIQDGLAYIEGRVTLEELLAKTLEPFRHGR